MSDCAKVKSFPLSAVIPYEAQHHGSDYASLLRNVVREGSGTTGAIHLVDDLGVCDPRTTHPECVAGVKSELGALISRDVFRLIDRRNLPTKANLLGGHIIQSAKNEAMTSERFKVRCIFQGHRDAERAVLVHDYSSLRHASFASSFLLRQHGRSTCRA